MPFSSWADTASRSDAVRVASSSSAMMKDEYMESDAFDDLNAPMLLSSGDGLVYGTDYVYRVRYRNSAGTLKWVNAVYTGGFYRFSPPASGYYPDLLYAQVYKSGLPKTSATYGVTATFLQGNIDFGEYVTSGFCEVYESAQNVTESAFATTGLSYTNTGESYVVKGNVKLTRTSIRVNIGLALKKVLTQRLIYRIYLLISILKTMLTFLCLVILAMILRTLLRITRHRWLKNRIQSLTR